MNKRLWIITIIILLVMVASYFVYRGFFRPIEKAIYKEVEVTQGDILIKISATGVVEPRTLAEIKSPTSGKLEEISVREGGRVVAGQIIARISSADREALLSAAQTKEERNFVTSQYKLISVTSPISGKVTFRGAEPGEIVSTDTILASVADKLIINAQIDETDIGKIKIRQEVVAVPDAYLDKVFSGKIIKISSTAKVVQNVTTFDVLLDVRDPKELLKSGMTCNVDIIVDSRKNVLMVPNQMLRERNGRKFVMLKDSKVKEPKLQRVKVGLSDGLNSEIIEGLSLGQKVIITSIKRGNAQPRLRRFRGFFH